MSFNLVQFLTEQGKFSGKNLDLEKKSSGSSETVPETLDASKPLGSLAHNVGDPVKAKTLTAPVTGKSVHIDTPEEQKPSSVESNREVVNVPISKPVQSFDKPAPEKPEMLHFSRVPHNVTEKIAALKEKYKDKDCGGAEEDNLGVCCEHCASGERKIKAIKRASALFKGDSGWQFMCGEADHDPRNQVVVELGEVLEKNSMLREYIHSPVDSVFVLDELRTKIASEISEQTKLAFQRNSGVRYNGEVFSNSDDVELLNKLGYSINFDEYSALDLYSEQQNIYTYLEKVAGIPKEVSEAVDKGEAFSGEFLKEMSYSIPKGYEIKGDLVCPLEKKAAEDDQHKLVHYSNKQFEKLRPLTYEELLKDRISGRWEKEPDKAKKYVEGRKDLENYLRKRLKQKGILHDKNKTFLYATLDGREQFAQPDMIKHEALLTPEIINQSFFDVVGLPSRTMFGQKGLDSAIRRWDKNKDNLKTEEYMGMTIRPRIEIMTPAEIATQFAKTAEDIPLKSTNINLVCPLEKKGSALIVSGIHGDEPAGDMAAEKLKNSADIVAHVNPSKKRRFEGKDINRHFDRPTEGKVQKTILDIIRKKKPSKVIALHEDDEVDKPYAYSSESLKNEAREALKNHDTASSAHGDKTEDGVISDGKNPPDGSLEKALDNRDIPRVTLETPSKAQDIDKRVETQLDVVKKLLNKTAEDDRPHHHLILRIEADNLPNSEKECNQLVEELAKEIDMKIVYGPKTKHLTNPETEGYSTFAIITTSHISLHIWNKTNPPLMQIDIFSCNAFSREKVEKYLRKKFKINKISDVFIDRTSAVKVKTAETDPLVKRLQELLTKRAAHELKSTNIKSVDYNKENKSLDVEFHSGGTYTYKDVPKSLFDRIRKVKSPGKFFHKHIKKENKFEYNKLEKEE